MTEKTYIFRVRIKDDKKIFREIEVPENITLCHLAECIIIACFNFQIDHCYGFYSKTTGAYYNSDEIYELFVDLGEEPTEGAKSVYKTKINRVFNKIRKEMLFL